MGILSYMTAFGLAAGAGYRACMVILALGVFHYTPYFELSESYAWVATVPVMFVVAFLAVLDILADAFPDISEFNDIAQYLPGLVAGFLCFAAMTGSVDNNLLHLVMSGVLGGGVSTGARFVRNGLSDVSREISEGLGLSAPHYLSSGAESMGNALIIPATIIAPVVGIVLVLVGLGLVIFFKQRYEEPVLTGLATQSGVDSEPEA